MKHNGGAIWAVIGLLGIHFFCCGLPLLAAIFGAALPFAHILSETVMNIIFIISGLILVLSWVHYFTGCKCNRTILIISSVLFITVMLIHFLGHSH